MSVSTFPVRFRDVSADHGIGDKRPAWAALAIVMDAANRGIPGKDASDLVRIEGDIEDAIMERGRDGILSFDPATYTIALAFGRETLTIYRPTPEAPVPTVRVILARFDGRPYVDIEDFATTDEADRYLAMFCDRDEDGGALHVLGITGRPGETFTVTAGGLDVAVVVRL